MLYATDYIWWEAHKGAPEFSGLKLSQAAEVIQRPQWGVRRILVVRGTDKLLVGTFGTIGWGGNSGFAGLNLAVQFGAKRIVLVGFDMRLDKGLHWHGPHQNGLSNPNVKNVQRWRRVTDEAAPALEVLGVEVVNASPISALQAYPKVDFAMEIG